MAHYQQNRQTLFETVAEHATGNLVIFRQTGISWTPDVLTAAIPCSNKPDTYLVLGVLDELPGWDESVVQVPNWEELLAKFLEWVAEMQTIADSTPLPKYEKATKPLFEDGSTRNSGPRWVSWIPENGGYSNASGRQMARNTHIIAPPQLVERTNTLQKHASTHKKLLEAIEKEKQAKETFQNAKKALGDAKKAVQKVQQELNQIKI